MINKDTFTFLSSDDLHQISACYWLPEGQPKAVLQITHGMIEYKERYTAFAEHMAENGIAVYAHDHLGHGDSVDFEEEWGYIKPNHPSDYLVEDMHTLRQIASTRFPDVPYYMLGHSMGSYLLRKYLTRYADGLQAAIIMGTGYAAPAVGALGITLATALAKVKGWDYRSDFIQNMTYDASYKSYDLTGKDTTNSWLTRKEDSVRRYYSDPKCTFKFCLSGHRALFEAVQVSCSRKGIQAIPKNLPILLISGEADPVGGLGEGVRKVNELYKAAGIQDVRLRLYPDARHEILNETNRAQVFRDILHYINIYNCL